MNDPYDPESRTSARRERDVLTPTRLNALAREAVERAFPLVWVEGEISNFSRPASGHLYFTLKDARAQVRCAMFRMRAMLLRVKPRDGMQVMVRARPSLYEGRGEFQLIVDHLEESGEGALRREFERLKEQLAAEGLFDATRKRALPQVPRRIGVLTSPTGAAIRDVLSVVRRRFPMAALEVLSVPVQGPDAPPRLVWMLRRAAASGRYDVLLLTRGGGSLEDLWAFNDERLARAIHASPVPVVSAVGHEIDFTIADFVADVRAPTPSAAAEMLVPSTEELCREIGRRRQRIRAALVRGIAERAQRLDRLWARLAMQRPAARLALQRTRLGALRERLRRTVDVALSARRRRADALVARHAAAHPAGRIAQQRRHVATLESRLASLVTRQLERARQRSTALARALHAVGPLATLERGYAIVFDRETGAVVRSVERARAIERFEVRLADGSVPLRRDDCE